MKSQFEKMAEPPPNVVAREITLSAFKALAWRLMEENRAEVSVMFGKIDAAIKPAPPMLALLAAYCLLDGLRRRNLKLAHYSLLEEAMREVAQEFGDSVEQVFPPT